jgi:hypothetical protein
MARELQIMPKSKKVPQENLGTLFFHGACFQLYLFASWASLRKKNRRGQNSLFNQLIHVNIDYKRRQICLMAWFAREQRFEAHFCEVDVSDGKTAKRNVWGPKFAIFSLHHALMLAAVKEKVTLSWITLLPYVNHIPCVHHAATTPSSIILLSTYFIKVVRRN